MSRPTERRSEQCRITTVSDSGVALEDDVDDYIDDAAAADDDGAAGDGSGCRARGLY